MTGGLIVGASGGAIVGPSGGGGRVVGQVSASESFIDYVSVKNTTGGTLTDEIVEFGFPTGPSELGSTKYLIVYDDNGSGSKGTVLSAYAVENTASDLSSNKRWQKVNCVIPSFSANQNRKLHVYSTTTAPPTGTSLTAANILDTSFQCKVTFVDVTSGTTYTADARSALAGSGTWLKTAAVTHGDFRDNPFCLETIVSQPLQNGGTAHGSTAGDGLRVWFHISAFKVGSGAYNSSTNPITRVDCDVIIENGDASRSSPENYLGSLLIERSTSLTNATLVTATDEWTGETASWSNEETIDTSSNNLTVTAVASTYKRIVRSSGTWPSNILGCGFYHSSGSGMVVRENSSTSITIKSTDLSAGTLSSGNATVTGTGWPYKTRWNFKVRVGNAESTTWAWGDHSDASTPTTRAHMDRAVDAKMTPNWSIPFGSATHSMTSIDNEVTTMGGRPFVMDKTTDDSSAAGSMRNSTVYEPGTGGRGEIAIHPYWQVKALAKPDSDGRDTMKWSAQTPNAIPLNLKDYANSGKEIRVDGTGTYYSTFNTGGGATLVASPTNNINLWTQDRAHRGNHSYLPYLMYGSLWMLENLQSSVYIDWANNDANYADTGTHRSLCFVDQQRGIAWGYRDIGQSYTVTPDSVDSGLALYTKAEIKAHSDGIQGEWQTRYVDNTSATESFQSGKRFVLYGPHWMACGDAGGSTAYDSSTSPQMSQWQGSYIQLAFGHLAELDALTADGLLTAQWMAESWVEATQHANAHDKFFLHYWTATRDSGLTQLFTWADFEDAVGVTYSNTWSTITPTGSNRPYMNLARNAIVFASDNGWDTNFTAASALSDINSARTTYSVTVDYQFELDARAT